MRNSKLLISLGFFLSLGLVACSTESKQTSDNRSKGTPATEKPVAADKGRLSLKMPKQDKVPYQKLEILLESYSDCGYVDGDLPEPIEPQPEPLILEDDQKETGAVAAKKKLALHADHADVDDETSDEEYSDDGVYSECSSVTSYGQAFDYAEEATVSIDDIIPGSYSIHVRLLDESGSATEEGYGYVEVAPGIVTNALVEIYPTQGNGRLDIQIIRGGDRISYDNGGLCSPSAYIAENGEIQYGDSDCYAHGSGSEPGYGSDSDEPVSNKKKR